VNWTVATDTPDLVYYQSFLDYGLGWKIHVLDEGEEPNSAHPKTNLTLWPMFASLVVLTVIRWID
jgi:hypothetical protein